MGLRAAWESFLWAFTLNRRVYTNKGLTYVVINSGGTAGNAHTMVDIMPAGGPLPQPRTVRIQCSRKPKKVSISFITMRGGWPVTKVRPKIKGGSVFFRLEAPAFTPPDKFSVFLHGVTAQEIIKIDHG